MITSLKDIHVVVGRTDPDGSSRFEDIEPSIVGSEEFGETTWLWQTEGVPTVPDDVGSLPEQMKFPEVAGTRVGAVCFPGRSAGKLRVRTSTDPKMHHTEDGDPGMHWTESVDYEFILSGKIDLELPGGEVRTLRPGSCLVMAGAPHAWKNRYDEPCIYVAVLVGARYRR